jgi:hypothetical protein
MKIIGPPGGQIRCPGGSNFALAVHPEFGQSPTEVETQAEVDILIQSASGSVDSSGSGDPESAVDRDGKRSGFYRWVVGGIA